MIIVNYPVCFCRELFQVVRLSEGLLVTIRSGLAKLVGPSILTTSQKIEKMDLDAESLSGCLHQLTHQIQSIVDLLPSSVPIFFKDLLNRFSETLCLVMVGSDESDSSDLLARLWILWGCLQLQCACPVSPLDPSMVTAHKVNAAQLEVCFFSRIHLLS